MGNCCSNNAAKEQLELQSGADADMELNQQQQVVVEQKLVFEAAVQESETVEGLKSARPPAADAAAADKDETENGNPHAESIEPSPLISKDEKIIEAQLAQYANVSAIESPAAQQMLQKQDSPSREAAAATH